MSERPILFSAPMVSALLAGTKTQTRRVIKYQSIGKRFSHMTDDGMAHLDWLGEPCCGTGVWNVPEYSADVACPYGKPGDRLWVRETFRRDLDRFHSRKLIVYRADDAVKDIGPDGAFDFPDLGWKPSIHMPRWASRITLEITAVRVERLQDISEEDAQAEGVDALPMETRRATARADFYALWESINGPGSWDENPWVWVVEFKRVEGGAA